jgi:hypothetical protein
MFDSPRADKTCHYMPSFLSTWCCIALLQSRNDNQIIWQTHCASEPVVMAGHPYKNHDTLVFEYSVFTMTLRVWEIENERAKKFPCNHEFLIKRLENLYGKRLGGQVQEALQYLQVKKSFN